MVRLKDIAERAGVSVMTVSKVLRDAPDISSATKTRVRLLAAEMGYVPDSMAQSLRTRTTRLFGLVISSTTNPIFARTLLALEEQAHELGYDLLLAHNLNLAEREEAVIRRFLARRIDGLFLSPVYRLNPEAPIYRELETRRIPTVILGPRAQFCEHFVNVETDDQEAARRITEHLLQLGHQRIAFLAGPATAPWAQDRLEGYRRALRDAQLECDDRLVFNAGVTIEEGGRAALQMLGESVNATAVLAVTDLAAIGAGNVFLNQGIRVPQDLSLAGFGNVLTSEYFRVPLTTVSQPKHSLGTAAMELMMKLLRGEPVQSRLLPTQLVIRSSTAAPPARH